ncbi:NAD-dependent epimerase/dehydratase family protein [Massilia dura]|uniref:NAD-dependent epimerase/dehydratase family protein n=1 Tax=Pseudoduganella dura TaxID=321982 RepID=A0A6I3XAE9_9BURK|nr:NAD-dependent epimerase/dehydratase family protein [Pseudoduganella dura]MUI11013.1 NAD-dependent epimerase/dehydratase family protein [Pseudoduganella dura]GGY19048.1 UDP-glucose 4-epimerase [Pseudoduganella dura]
MHIVITGAGGFVGAALARHIVACGLPGQPAVTRLTLVDRRFDDPPDDARVRLLHGDFGVEQVLDAMFDPPVDVLFHLASVPGAEAERDCALGYRVNLMAPLALFERAASQERTARIVYASSIAVYGSALPATVDDATPPKPGISYGAHKQVGEIVLADLSRRGLVNGISLRLPGIVARPGFSAGHGSAFMSAILRAAQAGEHYTCPVSPAAACWWMSLQGCVGNLAHAAALDTSLLPAARTVTLPVLRLTVEEVVAALARRFGAQAVAGIRWQPDADIERVFGRMPALVPGIAERLGFAHDGNVDLLVERAL